jgi:hypothetical protein
MESLTEVSEFLGCGVIPLQNWVDSDPQTGTAEDDFQIEREEADRVAEPERMALDVWRNALLKSIVPLLRVGIAQPWIGRRLARAILWNAVFLLLVAAAGGQTTSSITGSVRDSAEALVPGAKVTLINEASKATRSVTSNSEGFFTFVAVQPATYGIQVTMANFETWRVQGIEVHPGDSLTVPNIRLTVGKVLQEVVVTAEAAGVAVSSPEHSTMITASDISRLATVGRDALELVSILPGFTLNAGTGLNNTGPDYTTTSFGSGNLGSFGANGAAPQQGLVNISNDGVQVIDPGDMGATTANINMDQVQEVKVQTSNFGADEAKGPIVINAVGKSGGAVYHGSLYAYARNHIFNSNDWLSNDNPIPIPKTPMRYFYPGGTVGGPVKIPGTKFNRNKHMTFWAGFEYYDQTSNASGTFGGPQYAFIPTPAMLSGDFSTASLAKAFNVNAADLAAGCTEDYSQTAAFSNIGGDCFSPAGQLDQNGLPVPASGHLNNINPGVAAYTKYYPAINRVPQAANGYASDGYNWAENVPSTNNGFQLHSRVDQNFSDSLKLYGTYGWEKVNSESPLNNIYYNPPNTIPYPTPLYSFGYSDSASFNLTKIVNSSTTNELVFAGLYFDQPEQFGNRSLALDTGTPWAAAGYSGGGLKNGVNQLPRIYSYETVGVPNFSFGYVPPESQYLRKSTWDIGDNLTRIYRTHTVKAGIYAEQTRNNQVTLGSQANGNVLFERYAGCLPNQHTPSYSTDPTTGKAALIIPPASSLGNTAANFLAGCTGGYTQDSFDPSIDMYFNSLEFYATDEWKITPKLTLTFGIRLSHLPPWSDSHGVGAAVWDPTSYNKILPGVLDPDMTQDTRTWPGISWHKLNSSIPVAGVGSRILFYAPRAGLAYDIYGNGKSVVRGGWGAYRSRDPYNVTAAAVDTSVDLVHYSIQGTFANSCTLDQLFNSVPIAPPPTTAPGTKVQTCGYYTGSPAFDATPGRYTTSGAVGSIAADNPHDREQPVTYNYNLTLDQQLPYGAVFELTYIGNQSTNLSTLGNLQNQNVIPLGAFFGPDPLTHQTNPTTNIGSNIVNDYRPYPNYQQVDVPSHTNWANYNAMQASLNKQRGSLVVGINYTWSKAMGVRGNYDTGYIADPANAHHDYGIVSFDRPQAANFSYSYQEGNKFHGNRELGWVLNSWELSGITKLSSGPDLAILNGTTNFGFSASATYYTDTSRTTSVSIPVGAAEWLGSSDYTLQPTITCDPRLALHSAFLSGSQISRQYANGNCFAVPAQGTQGWWNLPDVHGPAYFSSDLSVYKDVQIDDRQSLQFRMSGFNFLNHAIPSFNNNNLAALNLTYEDPPCTKATGAGCIYSQQAAFSGLTLENAGFGYTPYKFGLRFVEFGVKYNF